jgi:hypothetical protein
MVVMFTLAVFVTVFLDKVIFTNKNTGIQSNGVCALYAAEAGINKAMWYLLNVAPDGTTDASWRTTAYPAPAGSDPRDPKNEDFEQGSYTFWVQDSPQYILITAQGLCKEVLRTVHQEFIFDAGLPKTLTPVAGTWGEN